MKSFLFLILMVLPGQALMLANGAGVRSPGRDTAPSNWRVTPTEDIFDLTAFGATGDGVTDDGPALQDALNAVADAGGGTLFVPAGRYAIVTPVRKDFSGLAYAVTILGVESSTPVPPPTSLGVVLTRGLHLESEFAPQTGPQQVSINITGLQSFLIKDITFIGKPNVTTDALIALSLNDVEEATVKHCEFYGVSSLVAGGAIIQAVRTNLKIDHSVLLGNTCSSGVNSSIVQNIEWKGISVSDTIFADYGQRPELYGKMNYAAPYSWINIGNAAALTSDSPRRETVIRNVFLDEGGFVGLTSLPNRYQPPSAPIDLLYITGLYMNVSNLGTTGHYFMGLQRLLVENSHYGWSHNTDAAITLFGTGNAILDGVVTEASATRIRADAATVKLTVINSTYEDLASQAQTTRVITTETPEDDAVQYVRQQFTSMLGREPDAAAHFYWADRLLQCEEDTQCAADERTALGDYLETEPPANFSVAGQVTDENGVSLAGVAVTLRGSQSVTTPTDAYGRYQFSNLPTSGIYSIAPSKTHYTFDDPIQTFITPDGDQTADFAATLNRHSISGYIADANGHAVAGVTVSLSGTQSGITTTDAKGYFSFANVSAGGNYSVVASKTHYTFAPANMTFDDLGANQKGNFTATLNRHTITGRATRPDGGPLEGVRVTLSGTQTATVITDANGAYVLADLPAGGGYTLTPSKTSYSWAPRSLSFNDLSSNQTANFKGTFVTYTISGRVMENENGLGGVSVILSGSQAATATTDSNGSYSFILPSEGSYTITPAKKHYTFGPASLNFNNLNANHTADLTATLNTHSISGRVTKDGAGLADATVTLSSSQSSTTANTDVNGAYSFSRVPAGDSYTVIITKANYTFAPVSYRFNNLGSDQELNFSAFLNPALLTIENSQRAIALESVTFATSPFSLISKSTLGSTSHTRIIVFAMNIDLQLGESPSAITAQAEDSQHRVFALTVEYVGRVPELAGVMQINLILPDQPAEGGDLWINLDFHGLQSNKALITIKPS
jgi:hypothetical protein